MSRVIIDVEATCWEFDKEKQRRESETIEIGAVFTDDVYNELGRFQTFIRPVRNPILTDFCTTLTSITQEQIDKAPGFIEAMEMFVEATDKILRKRLDQIMFCSWGNYDRNQFERDCSYHHLPYPFGVHRNLKNEFAKEMGCKPCGLSRALGRLNISFTGVAHRGIDDAANITNIAHTLWGPPGGSRLHLPRQGR